MLRTIARNVPGGIVVRQFGSAHGCELAWRKRDGDPRISRSDGHKGPWLLVPREQVPPHILTMLERRTGR